MSSTAEQLRGGPLGFAQIVAFADADAHVAVDHSALRQVARGHRTFLTALGRRPVYGANTGVGANKSITVTATASHGKRLLRSHCTAVGPLEGSDVNRVAMCIRLNQLLVGASGISPELVEGLAVAVAAGSMPRIHQWGSVGTGDIAQLAELALTLEGERPWMYNAVAPVSAAATDALPFMSSSAFTLARAALATRDCLRLLQSLEDVAAITALAVAGCRDAWDPRVHTAKGHPFQLDVARRLFDAVRPFGGDDIDDVRVQDRFGLRTLPSVHAPAHDALARLATAIELECSSGSENPLVVGDDLLHHGLFHQAALAALLDQVRATVVSVLNLAAARVSMLNTADLNGVSRFLATSDPGSSGLMVGEYVVQDVLATARALAYPTSHSAISISLGTEDHASFAPQGARQLADLTTIARVVVATEAVAAVRALRLHPSRQIPCRALETFGLLDAVLSHDMNDQPMGEDLELASTVLWDRADQRVGTRV
jgi:histidine ammonia-lyase